MGPLLLGCTCSELPKIVSAMLQARGDCGQPPQRHHALVSGLLCFMAGLFQQNERRSQALLCIRLKRARL